MDQLVTETGLYTILTDVEASVNVRPLSSTSENPDDKNILPLTPCHIMLVRTLDTTPNEIHKGVEARKICCRQLEGKNKNIKQILECMEKEYLTNIRKFSKQNKI